MSKLPISAVLITKNEAHNLPRCIGSLGFCSEVIVLDSGSTDDTVSVAESLGATVHETQDWPGFGPQKNRALSYATQSWVLSIDADEWIEPKLFESICLHVKNKTAAASVLRSSTFCGHRVRHSGWGDDWVLRLFRHGSAKFSDDLVHERVIAQGPHIKLEGCMGHETYRTVSEAVSKMNQYSSAWAEQRAGQEGPSVGKIIVKTGFAFFRTYFLKAGWLDGAVGFHIARLNALGTYLKYTKLSFNSR